MLPVSSRQVASIVALLVRPVAVPIVSGVIEMCIRRHLHGDASLVDSSIAAIALPITSVGVHRISVLGNLDRDTCLIDLRVASSALPIASVRVHQLGVFR